MAEGLLIGVAIGAGLGLLFIVGVLLKNLKPLGWLVLGLIVTALFLNL